MRARIFFHCRTSPVAANVKVLHINSARFRVEKREQGVIIASRMICLRVCLVSPDFFLTCAHYLKAIEALIVSVQVAHDFWVDVHAFDNFLFTDVKTQQSVVVVVSNILLEDEQDDAHVMVQVVKLVKL